MKTLILGRSEINRDLCAYLGGEGVETVVMENIMQLRKFQGEPGAYIATGQDGAAYVTSVIVTEPPRFRALEIGGEATVCLTDSAETEKLSDPKQKWKVVILLDYGEESPEYITTRAITLAKRLAENKKEVVVLSRFIKSGHAHGERRFKEARNAGVRFIKYDEVALHYDEDADIFGIGVRDELSPRAGVLRIETPALVTAISAPTPELEAISKKLRIRQRPGGHINSDRFFLHRVFTTRRGIYYFNPALETPEPGKGIREAMRPVLRDMEVLCVDGYEREIVRGQAFPEVDAGKCAFCYSCYRACPHGALAPDMDASAMKVVESLCQSCGICVAICPGEAIARKAAPRTDDGMAAADADKTAAPDIIAGVSNARCKIYLCENGAARAFEEVLPMLGARAQSLDSVRVACGGNVSADMLTRDLADYDAAIVCSCMPDACRHLDGDKRVCKQTARAAELFAQAGIGAGRVYRVHISHAMPGALRDRLEEILEDLK